MSEPIHLFTLTTAPPSVNAMWRAVVRGKAAVNILSKEGRAWKKAAIQELAIQTGGFKAPSYWRADILIPGAGARIDLDNYLKGIMDALHEAGKTPDDSYLCDLRIRFSPGDKVVIAIKKEEITKWATIRKASKSLTRKLATRSS